MTGWSTRLHFHCTVAWCGTTPGKVDRGMGVHGRLWLSGNGLTGVELRELRSKIVEELDHQPLSVDKVMVESEVAAEMVERIETIVQGRYVPRMVELEIVPDGWWVYRW